MATASLVALPRAVFYDSNGNPLSGGSVATYIPNTTTPKQTWQDSGETTPNSNPITLDADGSCLLYGSGLYQLTVTDSLGNAIPAYSGVTGDLSSVSGISTAMLPVVGAASTSAAALLLGLPSVANIAALRLLTTATSSSPVYVDGYYSGADGGGGVYWVNATDGISTDNGGTIIVDASNRRWYLETGGGAISTAKFGCKGDGTTDDSAAFSAADTFAAAATKTLIVAGTSGMNVLFGTSKTLNSVIDFTAGGDIAAASGVTVTLKGQIVAEDRQIFGGAGTFVLSQTCAQQFIVEWWGVKGDGITDCAPGWSSLSRSIPSGGTRIQAGVGKYRFNTAISATLSGTQGALTLAGMGDGETIFYFPNAGTGLSITVDHREGGIHIRDMSFTTGAANGGTGLSITQEEPEGAFQASDIINCTFRGDDGGQATEYWTTGLDLIALSGVNIINCNFYGNQPGTGGTGIHLTGNPSVSPNYEIVINVQQSGFYNNGIGISYDSYVQGLAVDNCNFTNGVVGIHAPSTATGVLAQLSVCNSQFNCTADTIRLEVALNPVNISNTVFFCTSGAAGINLGGSLNVSITGCSFVPVTGGAGTGIIGTASFVAITGNTFDDLSVGVATDSPAAEWAITGNVFQACSAEGVLIQSSGVMICGNVFNGNGLGINVPTTSNSVNIQSNYYSNNTTNTSPASTTGGVKIGGGSP
jgi:hypothetical protein